MLLRIGPALVLVAVVTRAPAQLPFVPDEFESAKLAPGWTAADSGRIAIEEGDLVLRPAPGSERRYSHNASLWISQPAPAGSDWEILARVDAFDPVLVNDGVASPWSECGLQVFQDERHWFGVWLNTDPTGHRLDVTGGYQFQPAGEGRQPFDPRYCGDSSVWGIEHLPVWLRIRKTRYGYFGAWRTKGEEWRTIGPFARNPESPADGFMRGERIRLYATSPAPDKQPPVCRIAFIRHRELEPLPRAAGSDTFSLPRLSRARWGFYSGSPGEGILEIDGTGLSMTPDSYQDQWVDVDTAMRVYQDAPTSGPWRAAIKAGPTDLLMHHAWSAWGLMLWQDQNHWILLRNQVDDQRQVRTEAALHDRNGRRIEVEQRNEFRGELPAWLCIEHWGDRYRCGTSRDGITWEYLTDADGFAPSRPLRNAQLQLLAVRPNDNDAGTTLTARFDEFRLEALGEGVR